MDFISAQTACGFGGRTSCSKVMKNWWLCAQQLSNLLGISGHPVPGQKEEKEEEGAWRDS